MKTTTAGNYLYFLFVLCLVASRNLVLGFKKFDTYAEAKTKFASILKGPYPWAHGEQVDTDTVHDVMGALMLCQFVYGLGDLRTETKALSLTKDEIKKIVGGTENEAMTQVLMGNKMATTADEDKSFVRPQVTMEQVEKVLEYKAFEASNKRFGTELMCAAVHTFSETNVFLYHFDAKYNDKNLVYAIAGRERKQGATSPKKEIDLILTFRGSQTARDWMQNIQTIQVDIALRQDPNDKEKCFMIEPLSFQRIPITKELYGNFTDIVEKTGEPIRIHKGFLSYLFADRGEDGLVTPTGLRDSMFDHVKTNLLRLLKKDAMTTNNLYVTGHSLGGSLATVAAFFLASSKDINDRKAGWNGIKCIAFAGPSSGNISYQRALEVLANKGSYQLSESKKQGRSMFSLIRVNNHRDLVPMLIPFSRYRHAPGVQAHLGRPSYLLRIMRLMDKPSVWVAKPFVWVANFFIYFFSGFSWFFTPTFIKTAGLGKFADYLQSPTIQRYKAHWRRMFSLRFPWMMFHPLGFWSGLFGSWGRFLSYMFATVPLLFIPLLLLLRPIYILMKAVVPISGSRLADGEFSKYSQELQTLLKGTTILEEYNKWGVPSSFFTLKDVWGKMPGWGIFGLYTVLLILFTEIFSPLWYRFLVVFLGLPGVVALFLRNFDGGDLYHFFNHQGGPIFIVLMIAWQIILCFGRAPWDVLNPSSPMKVHDLNSYYEHMRPYHKMLSSSDVLIDKYLKNME